MKQKCVHRESMPLKEFNVMKKAPTIEGMKVSTVRKESRQFNQPMAHIYYKPKSNEPK